MTKLVLAALVAAGCAVPGAGGASGRPTLPSQDSSMDLPSVDTTTTTAPAPDMTPPPAPDPTPPPDPQPAVDATGALPNRPTSMAQ